MGEEGREEGAVNPQTQITPLFLRPLVVVTNAANPLPPVLEWFWFLFVLLCCSTKEIVWCMDVTIGLRSPTYIPCGKERKKKK